MIQGGMDAERIATAVKLYPVLCAWCTSEGYETVVSHGEVEHSHGMCFQHSRRMLQKYRSSHPKLSP